MTQRFLATLILISSLPLSAPAEERLPERLRERFWTQGEQVRNAFVPVIRNARRGTVEFLKETEPVALGAVIDGDGWILTKASQIGEADLVTLQDGRRVPFEYIGHDVKLDLALVRVNASRLTAVEWETEEPKLGAWVVTTGQKPEPLGIGVVSVPRRSIEKSSSYGVLGIALVDVSPDVAAIIESVFPNSGASRAGLEANDEVLSINSSQIAGRRDLIRTIHQYRPGDTVIVEVDRDGEKKSFSVTLTHPFGDFLSRIAFQQQLGGPLSFRRDDFEAVLQHDTVLRPEQCGGPAVNIDGKAIGINIARAGRTASYLLPADLILPKIEALKSGEFPPPIAPQSDADTGE
ncbi:putative periplasmic serine endoprotease DegP-like precursor [Thalassoglobus neptunius]|uniref:Putative periplasmic serine endoprotease DegP-like n=1 Tax=Thalassoglobus neptunius TaxID=1938619 RepID=A0A5C5WNS5_9PLAN|nr:PDZ domain-containing protein [Thalassoglobus neptunius]TWT52288.1 putative periplasmic serine endoprotease DegP-like precursor [Thalassoglobus neptunius]